MTDQPTPFDIRSSLAHKATAEATADLVQVQQNLVDEQITANLIAYLATLTGSEPDLKRRQALKQEIDKRLNL